MEISSFQRLDKWLKTAHLFKTRTQAARACDGNLVKVNDITAKPSKMIRPRDTIIIRFRGKYRSFTVLALSERSIPAKDARLLYEETTDSDISPENKELIKLVKEHEKTASPRKYKGRPTKKERRTMTKWQNSTRLSHR